MTRGYSPPPMSRAEAVVIRHPHALLRQLRGGNAKRPSTGSTAMCPGGGTYSSRRDRPAMMRSAGTGCGRIGAAPSRPPRSRGSCRPRSSSCSDVPSRTRAARIGAGTIQLPGDVRRVRLGLGPDEQRRVLAEHAEREAVRARLLGAVRRRVRHRIDVEPPDEHADGRDVVAPDVAMRADAPHVDRVRQPVERAVEQIESATCAQVGGPRASQVRDD